MKKPILLWAGTLLLLLFSFVNQATAQCSTSQPRPIDGPTRPCAGDLATYSIEIDGDLSNSTRYIGKWYVPRSFAGDGLDASMGWDIIKVNPGVYTKSRNTTTFSVDVKVGEKSGTVKVTVTDPVCGNKVATLPVKPGKDFEAIITGPVDFCPEDILTYTVTIVPLSTKLNLNNGTFIYEWGVGALPQDEDPGGNTGGEGWVCAPLQPNSCNGSPTFRVIAGMKTARVSVIVTFVPNKSTGGNGSATACLGAADHLDVELDKSCIGTPFPVVMTSFNGMSRNGSVELNWSTASEKDNDFFEVERSLEGRNFQKVGQVKGSGNSTMPINYSFKDRYQSSGIVYYRLRQVDYDGAFEYSKVIAVKHSVAPSTAISVVPNPVINREFTVYFSQPAKEAATIRLLDMAGRQMLLREESPGKAEVNLNLRDLSLLPGVYLLSVRVNGHTSIQRVMIQ